MESDGNSCKQQKNELVNNCQKLLKAVDTAHHNMDELVAKIEGKYGTANIEVIGIVALEKAHTTEFLLS